MASRYSSHLRTAGWLAALIGILAWPAAAQQEPAAEPLVYAVGIGDVLEVSVWKSPELSASQAVRPDGMVALPLIGDVAVAGLEPDRVRRVVAERLQEYVTAPAVAVIVRQIQSRKIYVIGEVGQAGVYDILGPTRLLQALAMAGGLTEFAKKDEIVVLRNSPEGQRRITASFKSITAGRSLHENLVLIPGDTIVVP